MRLLGILLVLAGASSPLLAQTNAVVEVRQLSLQDAIELALKHNLSLQIDRYNPAIALFTLKQAYGVYDPTLNLSGEHDHRESGSQILGGGFTIPGSVSDDNSFSGGLSGALPWGTSYNLSGNTADTYGSSGALGPDFSRPLSYQTNTFFDAQTGQPITSVTTNYALLPVRSPFENSSASASITVSQPLLKNLWIDANRLTIQVARNRLKYSELTLKLQIMQIVTQLEQGYYDLIYDRENVIVQQKAVELADRLVMENKKRLEVGALAPLDLQSAEAQAASSRAAVFAAQSQLGTQERLVKQLITDQYHDWAFVSLQPAGSLLSPSPS